MSEGIVIAIIGAIGIILSAIIAGVFSLLKKDSNSKDKTVIEQKQKGKTILKLKVHRGRFCVLTKKSISDIIFLVMKYAKTSTKEKRKWNISRNAERNKPTADI